MIYKIWNIQEALKDIVANPAAKFEEGIDISLNLKFGSKNKKSSAQARGILSIPYGTGKNKTIAIIAKSEDFDNAKKAGADRVGEDDLLQDILSNKIEYDCYIATPAMMRNISSAAKILGPKGLMPNIKSGTITNDFELVVPAIKKGLRIAYKSDRNGVVNMRIGSIKFDVEHLSQNISSVIDGVLNNKPENVDKIEIFSAYISSTMGKSYRIALNKRIENKKEGQ